MNLPSDRIHHITYSFGRVVLPMGRGRAVAWFGARDYPESGVHRKASLRIVRVDEFHNCRATGIY